jgi:23S rRNA (adenine-N6)-dimethyltransferase
MAGSARPGSGKAGSARPGSGKAGSARPGSGKADCRESGSGRVRRTGTAPAQPSRGRARRSGTADRARGAPRATAGRTEVDRRRRELSQNYLRGQQAARQFLTAVRPDRDSVCVEVGAGEGILTVRLAALFAEVIAYEIDESLAGRLAARVADRANVRVVLSDFLVARPPPRRFQVVGNAPFSLTAPIVDWCLRPSRMTAATLITQLEYARKRTGGYGRWTQLTVSTWPQFSWQLAGTIARTEFRPVPRVDAGILRLARRAEPLVSAPRLAAYRRLVQTGFSGVGGSVQASLRRSFPPEQVAAACGEAGVDRRTVVAYVSPDQWVQIFLALDGSARSAPASRSAGRRAADGRTARPGS